MSIIKLLIFLICLLSVKTIYAETIILKGKILKIQKDIVLIQLNEEEGCSGKKRFKINDPILIYNLEDKEKIKFKATINRRCEGNIIEVY